MPSRATLFSSSCALLLAATACGGPSISVARMAVYPAKAADCQIAVINGVMQNPSIMASPGSDYEMVGMITLGEHGAQDPFSDRYMAEVRPRACKMGGDAISLAMSSQAQGRRGGMIVTGTAYVVLRKRAQAPEAAPPVAPGTQTP